MAPAHRSSPAPTGKVKFCVFCGRWPACLYRDPDEKHGDRVCEFCVEEGRVIRTAESNWTYFIRPVEPAATAESPDSDSRNSSQHLDAPDSAA